MLSVQAVLALLQSFLMQQRRSRSAFPQMPLAEETFGAMCWKDAAKSEERRIVLEHMHDMLFSGNADRGSIPVPPGQEKIATTAEILLAAWQSSPRRITFFTSGSTGTPKACSHSPAMFAQEAAFLRPYFQGRARILSVVPAHHLYGFSFGVHLPACCGIPVHRTIALPHIIAAAMRPGDAVIGLPLLWQALLKTGHVPSGKDILAVSATAPIEKHTLRGLEQAGFRIADIFGSSETGVAGMRTASHEAYRLAPHFFRTGPDMLERSLPDAPHSPVCLEDHLHWRDDRHFLPTGRRDNAVQVGGVNVYPARIAAKIQSLPGIAACAVRPMRPEEGTRLKAFIVPLREEDTQELKRSLRRRLKRMLSVEECPVSFSFGPSLPRNSMGKLADW